ncbi:MAG: response regulator [Candidatus Riflebacteria bacterium]|nr:response regulator [Candidatus Riflebacteria bacterium]
MPERRTRGKVLVIDDNESVLKSVRWVLELSGLEVVTTRSVICANLIFRERPDLILMDVNMPGMKGSDAGRIFMKTVGMIERVCIVLHSSLSPRELETLVRESGVAGYIQKTHDPEELVRQVDRWIEVARSAAAGPGRDAS